MKKTKKQKLPRGWTQERLGKLAEYYDNQSEEEQVAEHEAALHAGGQTIMAVPTELVPDILRLIETKKTA